MPKKERTSRVSNGKSERRGSLQNLKDSAGIRKDLDRDLTRRCNPHGRKDCGAGHVRETISPKTKDSGYSVEIQIGEDTDMPGKSATEGDE